MKTASSNATSHHAQTINSWQSIRKTKCRDATAVNWAEGRSEETWNRFRVTQVITIARKNWCVQLGWRRSRRREQSRQLMRDVRELSFWKELEYLIKAFFESAWCSVSIGCAVSITQQWPLNDKLQAQHAKSTAEAREQDSNQHKSWEQRQLRQVFRDRRLQDRARAQDEHL